MAFDKKKKKTFSVKGAILIGLHIIEHAFQPCIVSINHRFYDSFIIDPKMPISY